MRASLAFRDGEKPRLVADLGQANFLMLRNYGLLVVGKTIADAFLSMYTFENTCRIQLDAQAGGELTPVNPLIVKGVAEAMRIQTAYPRPNVRPAARPCALAVWITCCVKAAGADPGLSASSVNTCSSRC